VKTLLVAIVLLLVPRTIGLLAAVGIAVAVAIAVIPAGFREDGDPPSVAEIDPIPAVAAARPAALVARDFALDELDLHPVAEFQDFKVGRFIAFGPRAARAGTGVLVLLVVAGGVAIALVASFARPSDSGIGGELDDVDVLPLAIGGSLVIPVPAFPLVPIAVLVGGISVR
jgi:hypothetical protein